MAILKKQSKKKSAIEVSFAMPVAAFSDAQTVKVLGDFNEWNVDNGLVMKKVKDQLVAKTELVPGKKYQFRYLADNQVWENDYQADQYVWCEFAGMENSVVDLEVFETVTAATKKEVKAKAPVAKKEAKAAPTKKATTKATTKKTTTPTNKAQNVQLVNGIGPKLEKFFKAANIVTLQDLISATDASVQAVITSAGSRFKSLKAADLKKEAKKLM